MIYHTIRIRFQNAKTPLYFIGSQLRGAFGYALKRTVCINPAFECSSCFAADNCLYYDFYESKEGYHPYRFDFELGKSYYDFRLYLFGEATSKLAYVVSALHRMLTDTGIGKERFKVTAYELFVNGASAMKEGKIVLPTSEPLVFEFPNDVADNVKVHFITPLRIKSNNRFVRHAEHLTLRALINSLYQRSLMLEGKDRAKLPFEPQGKIVDRFAHFKDLTRYSGRQKGKLKIGGLLGEMTIEGLDGESYRLLKLGELIGVGKQTVFGLGKIAVEEL